MWIYDEDGDLWNAERIDCLQVSGKYISVLRTNGTGDAIIKTRASTEEARKMMNYIAFHMASGRGLIDLRSDEDRKG